LFHSFSDFFALLYCSRTFTRPCRLSLLTLRVEALHSSLGVYPGLNINPKYSVNTLGRSACTASKLALFIVFSRDVRSFNIPFWVGMMITIGCSTGVMISLPLRTYGTLQLAAGAASRCPPCARHHLRHCLGPCSCVCSLAQTTIQLITLMSHHSTKLTIAKALLPMRLQASCTANKNSLRFGEVCPASVITFTCHTSQRSRPPS
jgi:hypothetical protein